MVIGKNMQLAIANFNKHNTPEAPRYVNRIIEIAKDVIKSKYPHTENDAEFKMLALRLIYMHLNGNRMNFGDDFLKEIQLQGFKSVRLVKSPSIGDLILMYDENPYYVIRLINERYFSSRRSNGIERLRELIKELK